MSTKVKIDASDLGDVAGQVERSLLENLDRLQMKSVDLMQLHNLIEPEVTESRMSDVLFATLGDAYGSRAEIATRFALSNRDVFFAVIGLSEPGYIDEAVAAAGLGPLPADAMDKLEALYENGFH